MLNILAAVLLFGFIVLVHEFGHFLLAKCSGIGVVEFSVGMGPRIFSVEKGRDPLFHQGAALWRFLYDGGRGRGKPGSEGF